ncbi:MAG TPA: L-histidine N(alpha)-methyltransferase [Candidatus Cybelea sp.]|nr:L-histidine N(alpha)-methyltransferase [Candidatus Cybelea sp.]
MRSARGEARFHDLAPAQESFRDAVLTGLSQPAKRIPCKFLYDARGSELFERICELPEYYPTRTEMRLLRRFANEIAAAIGPRCQLVEFGSGASAKSRIMLDALDRPAAYVPIDISGDHLARQAAVMAREFPDVEVIALCADFTAEVPLPPHAGGKRIAFFPGSTIGNLTPSEARDFLASWAPKLAGGGMIVGVDLKKDPAILNAAYNDTAGVTAAFILNLLARVNRELDGDFDLAAFAHRAYYEPDVGRVALFIESRREQTARVNGATFRFAAGERIHAEDSWKYSIPEFQELAAQAGFRPIHVWTDPQSLFGVHYLEAR